MNNRERLKAILNYENYNRMPIVHFGYWIETLKKWCEEGHLKPEEIKDINDGNENEIALSKKFGFDFNYYTIFSDKGSSSIFPAFEYKVIEELPDGMRKVLNEDGVIVLEKSGICSIPPEVGHLLVDRSSWEKYYLPRLQFTDERIEIEKLQIIVNNSATREEPLGLFCKSLFGQIRNWLGIEGISYLYVDNEELYDEIINTAGERVMKA